MEPIKTIKGVYQQKPRQWHVKSEGGRRLKNRLRKSLATTRPLRVGFVALCDCAPLVVAGELGLFEKYGLRVQLSREVGWATIRDKIIYRELDAAHALAPMVFAASLGLGSVQAPAVTGLVLSLNGNAITLAACLREHGVTDGDSLAAYARRRTEPLVFGIPFLYSSHHFLLRAWLRAHGLLVGCEVKLVVVPPPQMPAHLKAGHLHGYCVGEPWNSVAALAGSGWRAAKGEDIAPHHPEKVLMTLRGFAESRAEEHEQLIASLLEACRFCAEPENRESIAKLLGQSRYVNASSEALCASLDAAISMAENTEQFNLEPTLEPSPDKAAWVLQQLHESGLLPASANLRPIRGSEFFRADTFKRALQRYQIYESTEATT
jgi:ABC-type nitrate/sulfonate/bicarbonate transport system substrate-binding protein